MRNSREPSSGVRSAPRGGVDVLDVPSHLSVEGIVDGSEDDDLVVDEVLVEDVSIDGMCGVY